MFSASGTAALTAPIPNAPAHRLACAGATDPGRVRSHNEDRFGVYPDVGLFIVADGLGGAAAGEIAARMAIELVCESLIDPDVTWPRGTTKSGTGLPLLVDAIQRANHCIHGAALRNPAWRGMGTTVVALLAQGSRAALVHVGDSRIYRLRDRRLAQLTEDHSLFNDFVRLGRADPARPEAFHFHNVITRAVGTREHVEVDARLVDAAPGDTFLLCSDGLSGMLTRGQIESTLVAHTDLDEAAEQLISAGNQRGGLDNITVVLVRWEAGAVSRARS